MKSGAIYSSIIPMHFHQVHHLKKAYAGYMLSYIHKTLHDGIYIGRTTKPLYNLITNRAQNSIGYFSSTLFACPCLWPYLYSYPYTCLCFCPYLYFYPYTCLYSYLCSSDNVRDAKASWWYPACFVF
jgi:hypothetical protein